MSSITLISIALTFFTLGTVSQLIVQPKGCYKDGRYYPEGREFYPIPCRHCVCHNGTISCALMSCPDPLCVNPTKKPDECCPVCLNGRNCFAINRIIPAGIKVQVDDHTVCRCPDTIADGMDILQAVCYKTHQT